MPDPSTLDLILVRHAEPADTPVGTFLGRTNPPLGAEGSAQAQRVAELVSGLGLSISELLVSPLRRAAQSATPLARLCGLEPHTEDALREIDFGAWDGLVQNEIDARWDGAGSAWIADPVDRAGPGGESLRMVDARIAAWLTRWQLPESPGPVVVVAHFGTLVCLAARAIGLPIERAVAMRLGRGQAGRIERGVVRWWGLPSS